MKNIIMIAYDLNPKLGSEAGKAELWLKILSRHYRIHIFTDRQHKKDIDESRYKNVEFTYISVNDNKSKIYKSLKLYNLAYTQFIKKSKPIISHKIKNQDFSMIHCITPSGLHSYNDLYKFGIPVLIGPIGGGLKIPRGFGKAFRKGQIKNIIRDLFYVNIKKLKSWNSYFLNSRMIIIGTDYIKQNLPEPTWKRTVLLFDTMVDPDIFKPVKRQKTNRIKLCFTGRLEPQKGCFILIEAFRKIVDMFNNVDLIVAGDGSLLPNFRKLASKEFGEERMQILGKLDRKEIVNVLNDSDIFCFPSLREPGAVSVLEAMACGLPVIVADYGGPSISVTGNCGIKIKTTDYDIFVKNFTDAITKLIRSESLRKKMGEAGRNRVLSEFSPTSVDKKILKIYKSVINP